MSSKKKLLHQLTLSSTTLLLAASLTGWVQADETSNITPQTETEVKNSIIEDKNPSVEKTPSSTHTTETQNIALENAKILLPYADETEQTVYAEKISADDKLATTKLTSAITMQDKDIVTDVYGKEHSVNKLLLHYEDNSIEYKDLAYQKTDDDKHAHYQLDKSLKYTPKQVIAPLDDILDKLEPPLKEVTYKSTQVYQALGITENQEETMDKLYLEHSFVDVQKNVREFIKKVLINDDSIQLNNPDAIHKVVDSILENKEKVLLSLAYLNRWYDVAYGDIKSKELTIYRQDFFGMKNQPLELLLKIGSEGHKGYEPQNNYKYYARLLASFTGKSILPEFLESYREAFLPNMSNNDWFKSTSKAYIVEEPSHHVTDSSSNLYDRLKDLSRRDEYSTKKNRRRFRNMLLPLLTIPEHNLYIMNVLSTIIFGTYERYIDPELKHSSPTEYYEKIAAFEQQITDSAEKFRRHFDMWYRILPDEYKEQMKLYVPVWDSLGRYQKNPETNRYEGIWFPEYGEDSPASIQNFFGPVGAYNPYGNIKYVGAFADALEKEIVFVITGLISERGIGTLTHEMVHMYDYYTYLLRNGRRQFMWPEAFPEGFLQAPDNSDVPIIGINSVLDHTQNTDRQRFHNLNPERFQNADDLQEYMHGIFDVVYMMEYAEGMAVLDKDKAVQKKWFSKLETINIPNADGYDEGRNVKRPFTEEEWQTMSLKTIDDLVDYNVMTNRSYNPTYDKTIEFDDEHPTHLLQNGYDMITPFGPIYASAESPSSPGDLSFKRTGLELLAGKGFEKGLVPYASNQYKDEAWADSIQDWSVSDPFVFRKLLPEYNGSFAAFKKAMYHERIDQLGNLKPVTIHYLEQDISVDSFETLMKLMKEAVNHDIEKELIDNSEESQVTKLEKALLDAYLKSTDDFRTSIFKEKESKPTSPEIPNKSDQPTITTESKVIGLVHEPTQIKILSTTAALNGAVDLKVQTLLTSVSELSGHDYDLYDIALFNEKGEPVQLNGEITVVIPSKGAVKQVYSVLNDMVEALPFVQSKDQKEVMFHINHFSQYALVYATTATPIIPKSPTSSSAESDKNHLIISTVKTTANNQKIAKASFKADKTLPKTNSQGSLLGLTGLLLATMGATIVIRKKQ
ncbi:ZmpA/ZmpB/ZmpC family metallo-endopeptidase [Streptococcus pneumoniae]